MTPTTMTMASGRTINLAEPLPEDIFWPDVVECLIKLPRFGGATRNVVYTVAQHCCHAFDLAPEALKPHALLSGFAKAYLGERARPAEAALAAELTTPGEATAARARVTKRLTTAIERAAGLAPLGATPADAEARRTLALLDAALLATEKRDLLPRNTPPWPGLPAPLPLTLRPWGQDKAKAELLQRLAAIGINARF